MDYKVYRGLRRLLYAELTVSSTGEETWGKWKELAGLQSAEFAPNESSETVYFDNKAAIVMDVEGDKTYTFTTSVPSLETRTIISGRKWDTNKKCALGTKMQKKYYAIGFVYATQDGTEYLKVVLKGKFGGASESYVTEDNGTTHNTYSLTFNSIVPNKEVPYGASNDKAAMADYTFALGVGDEATYLTVGSDVMDVKGSPLAPTIEAP